MSVSTLFDGLSVQKIDGRRIESAWTVPAVPYVEYELSREIAAPGRRVKGRRSLSMRRFMRLTRAFSKKLENHAAMVSLYFMYYNFGRIHQTLRVTPAMEAGIADHVWSIEEIVGLLTR